MKSRYRARNGTRHRKEAGRSHITVFLAIGLSLVVSPRLVGAAIDGGAVLYVDDDAPPGGDGLSWTGAYRYLQDALTAAREPGSAVVEIRIGGGVYKPDRTGAHPEGTGDQDLSFELVSGVALCGGYAGFGFADPDFRSLEFFETILSGDLAGDDGPPGEFVNDDDNSHHVMMGSGLAQGTLIDGLVVTGGNNDIPFVPPDPESETSGGALHVIDGSLSISSCRFEYNRAWGAGGCYLENLQVSFSESIIEGNRASGFGNSGGIEIAIGQFSFTDCVFVDNGVAFEDAGALFTPGASGEIIRTIFKDNFADDGGAARLGSLVKVTDCHFISNHADVGGAVVGAGAYESCHFIDNRASTGGAATGANATFKDCLFRGNIATSVGAPGGGAIRGGGTMINCRFEQNRSLRAGGALSLSDPATVVNCLLVDNSADFDDEGGAVYTEADDVHLINCTIVGNTAEEGGGVFGPASLTNCVVWRNVPDQLLEPDLIRYCCVQSGWPGEGNIDADPLLEVSGLPALTELSPCIDAGDTSALPRDVVDLDGDGEVKERLPLDLANNQRLTDRPGTVDTGIPVCSLPVVDMGALEFQPIVFGDLSGDGRVGIADVILLLDAWGPCPRLGHFGTTSGCVGDLDRDGRVGTRDLILLFSAW